MHRRLVRVGLIFLFGAALVGLYAGEAPANHEGAAILSATAFFGTGILDVDFIITVDPPSDAGCLAHSWTLDFGDGSIPQSGGNTGTFNVHHQYTNFGTFTQIYVAEVQFTRQGQHAPSAGPRICEISITTAQLVVTIEPALPLIAVILAPETFVGPPPVDVLFDATETLFDIACPISRYLWDFGDGAVAIGPVLSHSFMQLGVQEVALTVEDRCGRRDVAKHPVIVRRMAPDGYEELDISLEQIDMTRKAAHDMLDEAQMHVEESFSTPFTKLASGAGAGSFGDMIQQLLVRLCGQQTLVGEELDQLIGLLEEAISVMGIDPTPFGEAKAQFEAALAKLQEAKSTLASDPASAFATACGGDGAPMKVDDGMAALLANLDAILMALQEPCAMLQMLVTDLLALMKETHEGYAALFDKAYEGYANSELRHAIGLALEMTPQSELERLNMTIQDLCQQLEQHARAPEQLFEGHDPANGMVPESVRGLEQVLDDVIATLKRTGDRYVPFDFQDGEFPTGLELLLRAKTPTYLELFGCFGEWVTEGKLGTLTDDYLEGTDQADVINGLSGDDTIKGLGDNDIICGGPGADVLSGETGDDVILGGPDRNTINGGVGSDILEGGSDRDVIVGSETGGDDSTDYLFGHGGIDELDGGVSGPDYLWGGSGDDTLTTGDSDRDQLDGGPDVDTLVGGGGFFDRCDGGEGMDHQLVGLDDPTTPGFDVPAGGGCEIFISIP